MKIGLIDVDSHNFPNLALMKISAWHKAIGDDVEMWNGLKYYDKVYASKVFDNTYTADMEYCINADEVIKGGTGYDLQNRLPEKIEHMMPDYSIYGVPEAYGFLTRGCPRGCDFCIVGKKEGLKSYKVADLSEFWTGQKHIKLLDPNITASKDCIPLLEQLSKSKAWVDFTQGIDIRCMTVEIAEALSEVKVKMLHFAWDNYTDDTIPYLLWHFKKRTKLDGRRLRVYVLTNFNTTHEQDLERIYKLRELDYDPYVMIYNKPKAPKKTKEVARWVNSKIIWRSCDKFENYKS